MGKQLKVLLIEDSENDALLLIHELERKGFEPEYERVNNAEDLKAALADKKWELILSDYKMPSFNGLEALKIIRSYGLDTPFIIVSGSIGETMAVEAMKVGANDYVMKGNLTRLVFTIERGLQQAEQRKKQREEINELLRELGREPRYE